MEFELEAENVGQPDEALLADLVRVAKTVSPAAITKALYDHHGRWCSATMRKRFGNWNDALRRAGIIPTKLMNISKEEILNDIKSVAAALGTSKLSFSEYRLHGRFTGGRTIYRHFGDWTGALRVAALEPVYEKLPQITDELCFKGIEAAWRRLGRQPRQSDVAKPESKVSEQTITKRFGTWRKALEAFVAYANAESDSVPADASEDTPNIDVPSLTPSAPRHRTTRVPGWRLRFIVMRRDKFRCLTCGKSPTINLGTELVLDHVVPWSKGGETTYFNLRTLCVVCNGGRGDLEPECEASSTG